MWSQMGHSTIIYLSIFQVLRDLLAELQQLQAHEQAGIHKIILNFTIINSISQDRTSLLV